VIFGDNAQLKGVFAWFDTVERAFFAFEHAHQLAVHVGVSMVAAFTFCQLKLYRNFIAFENLIFLCPNDFDTGPFRGFQSGFYRCRFWRSFHVLWNDRAVPRRRAA